MLEVRGQDHVETRPKPSDRERARARVERKHKLRGDLVKEIDDELRRFR